MKHEIKVRVVHMNLHGAFITLNGTIYISAKTLELCWDNDNALSLIIAHELSHFLLDHTPSKAKTLLFKHIKNYFVYD